MDDATFMAVSSEKGERIVQTASCQQVYLGIFSGKLTGGGFHPVYQPIASAVTTTVGGTAKGSRL